MPKSEVHKFKNAIIKCKSFISENWDGTSKIVMVNGVPVTSMIYESLANKLIKKISVKIILVDLIGTGGSYLRDNRYSWDTQREAMKDYFKVLGKFTLLVHDAAGPILLPLLASVENIEKAIILNTVIKPTALKPPFPLNLMYKTKLMRPLAPLTPKWYYRMKIKEHGITCVDKVSKDFLNNLYKKTTKNRGMNRLARIMNGFQLTETSDELIKKGIETDRPKLIIWGEKDPVLGSMINFLEPLLDESCKVVKIPEAKHFFMIDYYDKIADEIVTWY